LRHLSEHQPYDVRAYPESDADIVTTWIVYNADGQDIKHENAFSGNEKDGRRHLTKGLETFIVGSRF
jgi:hypothetical protein